MKAMKKTLKKALALLFAIVIVLMTFGACSGGNKTETEAKQSATETSAPVTETTAKAAGDTTSLNNISYVMIYNPDIYHEKSRINENRMTGNLGDNIDTGSNRAGDSLKLDVPLLNSISQDAYLEELNEAEIDISSDRSSYVPPTYSEGSTEVFYKGAADSTGKYGKEEYTCVYDGEHCYIWFPSDKTPDSDRVKNFGKEFDENVYPSDIKLFGEPRFSDSGNKISILIQELPEGYGGYFRPIELCTPTELNSEAAAAENGINVGYAMLHVSDAVFEDEENEVSLLRTAAHELQHLINFSDIFYTVSSENLNTIFQKLQPTWINEAMSGYAEQQTYPSEESAFYRYFQYATSGRIRNGQSLYNFTNALNSDVKKANDDSGVYGSVLYFTEYLTNAGGSDVFSGMHKYWRTSFLPELQDSDALFNSVASDYSKQINDKYAYPSDWSFATEDEKWMSKMTLDFYIYMMETESPAVPSGVEIDMDPEAFRLAEKFATFYDSVQSVDLEGGGRIIFPVKNGKYEIPADASEGLVYVGFDENFKQVTDIVYR